MSKLDHDIETKLKNKTDKPKLYKVIILNDDFTTQDFVVHLLKKFFNKSETEANTIMLSVHKLGRGIAGIYSKDIAETKVHLATDYAKQQGFPLMFTVESE